MDPGRTPPSKILARNSETVGSQSHSLNQLPLRQRSPRLLAPSKGPGIVGFSVRNDERADWAEAWALFPGTSDYHWQHEPCWYAVRTKGNWTGDRKQTTLWTIPSGGQDTETVHGTQKPVECMRRPMLNNSSPGQAVYDPFLGIGTALIAAQTSGRSCFAIELDPLYVDVAIRRWQAFTGEQATLLADSRAFDVVAAERLSTTGEA